MRAGTECTVTFITLSDNTWFGDLKKILAVLLLIVSSFSVIYIYLICYKNTPSCRRSVGVHNQEQTCILVFVKDAHMVYTIHAYMHIAHCCHPPLDTVTVFLFVCQIQITVRRLFTKFKATDMSRYVEAGAILLRCSNDPLLRHVVKWKFKLM